MTRNAFLSCLMCSLVLLASACGRNGRPDAYGIVDAHSWMVACSEPGQIVELCVEEGAVVSQGSRAVQLDTGALSLQLRAFEAQIQALRPTLPDTGKQLEVLQKKKESVLNEKGRIDALVASGAASSRHADELADQLAVIESQIAATRSSLSRETAAVMAEIESLKSQADIVRDRISRCGVNNPEDGTVTNLYAHLHEFVAAGQAVYRLSDLRHLYVDVWMDGATLAGVRVGDEVKVAADAAGGTMSTEPGRVSYIAQEAEFMPNKVLTRDTRTKQVYHVRIELSDGSALRPGMPVEIYLDSRL